MSTVLVHSTQVLMSDPVDQGDRFASTTGGFAVQKSLIPGYLIEDVGTLPAGFEPASYSWINGVLDYTPAPVPVETLLAYSANARYAAETGGITISGVPIFTDRTSQSQLTSAYNLAVQNQANSSWSVTWKSSTGAFATMNAATIIAVATVAGGFVQGCFATEAAVAAGVANGSVTSYAQVDARYSSITKSF